MGEVLKMGWFGSLEGPTMSEVQNTPIQRLWLKSVSHEPGPATLQFQGKNTKSVC